jgi:hypothetical protein
VLIDPIVPASERAAELGVLALLPPGFDGWFARCVDRDPAARFPDAEAARAAFERVAARATTDVFGATDPTPLTADRALAASSAAATSTNAEPLRARARRRTWLVAAAGALMIAAALAVLLRPMSKPATAQKYPPDLRHSETLMWARAVLDAAPPDEQSRGTRIQALEDIVTSRLVTPEMKQSAAAKLADIPPTALDPDIIRSVVREQAMPLMDKCYKTELATQPDLRAELDMSFSIQPDGSVKNAIVAESKDMPLALATCAQRVFQGLVFPHPRGDGTVTVRYPVSFVP